MCFLFLLYKKTTLDVDFLTMALPDPDSEDLDDPDLSNNVPTGIYETKFYLTSPFKLLEFCNSSVTFKILKHLYETNITVKTNYTNLFVVGNMEVRTYPAVVCCTEESRFIMIRLFNFAGLRRVLRHSSGRGCDVKVVRIARVPGANQERLYRSGEKRAVRYQ